MVSLSSFQAVQAQCCTCGNGEQFNLDNCGTCLLGCILSGRGFPSSCTCDDPLPIELSLFEATGGDDGIIVVSWSTASELNNQGFEVQRSTDGKTWNSLTFIAGNGTTSLQQDYLFEDRRPIPGINYYRLKQIDFDGAINYTDVRSVEVNSEDLSNSFQVYPNPAINGQFTVYTPFSFNTKTELQLYTLSGQLIASGKIVDFETNFSFPNLSNGLYLVKVVADEWQWQEKVFLK